jgi:O-antigen ligase
MVVLLCLLVALAPVLLPKNLLERYKSTFAGSEYEGVAGNFEPSTANRVVQNQAGLKLFMDSPIIGHGFEGFYYRSPKYLPPGAPEITRAAHSSFLMLGVGGGIISLAAFFWLLTNLGMAGKRLYEDGSDKEARLLGLFLLAAMVSKVLANFASTEFVTGDVTSYVWISAALVSRLQGDIRSRAPSAVRQKTRSTWRSRPVFGAHPPVMHG